MATNSVARRVSQKEVRLFFSSPVAWLFLACFAVVNGFLFFWVESFFARNIADIRPLFEWMPVLLIFLCAALSMNMWSEERRTGTLEYILTQPVDLWQFVIGKFRACFTLLLLALISTLPLPITVALIANLDWGPVIGGYLAAALVGATYLSIGLFVSARTDNPIVSLIGTVALCTVLYLLGSTTLTGFFDDRTGEILRLMGSGARFESISRGIIDLRDLFYYCSLITAFLALNIYVLEKERWAKTSSTARHRHWRTGTLLLLANLVLANCWLNQTSPLRLDMTEGKLYTISQPTLDFLNELQEPLLIRGYFSEKTHPLLAPLVPQLRDLLKEYELAGKGKVEVEFVDPADDPESEQEANERYGISATPFQIADRHESSLVNAYFNILVRYGSEHESLGFSELIEVRSVPNTPPEALLRNPEYDITHAIKKVLFDYRTGGNLFDGINEPIEFIGYVSADSLLPQQLQHYKQAIEPQLALAARHSKGKFSVRFIEPESYDGVIAGNLADRWGFKPMVASPGDDREFYFYLTLASTQQVVQIPTEAFNPAEFRLSLDAGLKRFARGFTKVVALSVPKADSTLAQYKLGGPTFANLKKAIRRDYSIHLEDLSDGNVTAEADILAVVAPEKLGKKSVFAIDQFLLRGGTVILVTSPYTVEISDGELRLQNWDSGLQPWLAHMGIQIEKTLVLDKQNAKFAAPSSRQAGDYEFRDVQLIDYPYFLDLRPPQLAPDHPITGNLPQVTMAWASPILTTPNEKRHISVLLQSSTASWLSDSTNITSSKNTKGRDHFQPSPEEAKANNAAKLGLIVKGTFDSFFTTRNHPLNALPRDAGTESSRGPAVNALLTRSSESAQLVLYASNDFLDDQILQNLVATTGTQYLGPVELFMNTLAWALQDDQLLTIRSRAHFNRTLPPMERQAQVLIEYFNYGLSAVWLLLVASASWLTAVLRRRRFARDLSL